MGLETGLSHVADFDRRNFDAVATAPNFIISNYLPVTYEMKKPAANRGEQRGYKPRKSRG